MIQITTAIIADIETISYLAHQIWWPTYRNFISAQQITFMLNDMYSPASLQNQMESGHTFKLLNFENKCCGFASYSVTFNPQIYKIQKIYLLPNLQGLGIGKIFIKTLEKELIILGAAIVQLNVNRENKAQFFYLKMGYKVLETINIPYHNFMLNDFIMQKTINAL